MIVGRLVEALNGSGIRVYAAHESTPSHDADQSGDTPVASWCKVHRVAMGAMQNNGAADQRSLIFTISVGVSPAASDADPHALDDAVQLVHQAIEHATRVHADGVHSLQLGEAESDIVTSGDHERDGTGVVSVVGTAKRASA